MHWSEEERQRIADAVAAAEAKGRGEIAVAVAPSSSDYAIYEWPAAVLFGFLWSMLLLTFQNPISSWIEAKWWIDPTRLFVLGVVLSSFLVISLVYALTNLNLFDRLLVPRKLRQQKVHERALRQFMESGVMQTRERTGILIFVSLLERRVVLLADRGINEKIDPTAWQAITDKLTGHLRRHQMVDGLCAAIAECGELLGQHFPQNGEDINELPDQPVLLEK